MTFIAFLLIAFAHPFYVGLTEIEYHDESGRFRISVKLFTDDLEEGVKTKSNVVLNLATEKEVVTSDSLIQDYINEHFELRNTEKIPLEIVGHESEYDVTWIYFESSKIEKPERIEIRNEVLMEVYEDQTHIIHYSKGQQTVSGLTHFNERIFTLSP